MLLMLLRKFNIFLNIVRLNVLRFIRQGVLKHARYGLIVYTFIPSRAILYILFRKPLLSKFIFHKWLSCFLNSAAN